MAPKAESVLSSIRVHAVPSRSDSAASTSVRSDLTVTPAVFFLTLEVGRH